MSVLYADALPPRTLTLEKNLDTGRPATRCRCITASVPRVLACLGGRNVEETRGSTSDISVSVTCGALQIITITTLTWLGRDVLSARGMDPLQATMVATGAALTVWWLDRQLLRAQEVTSRLSGTLAWLCRAMLPVTAAAVVWVELPRWYEPEVRANVQKTQAAYENTIAALAESERELSTHTHRQRETARERLATAHQLTLAKTRQQAGLAAAERCKRRTQWLEESIPADETSLLHVNRQNEWRHLAQTCTRKLNAVSAAYATAEQEYRMSMGALDLEARAAEQAHAAALHRVTRTSQLQAELQARLEACTLTGVRCAFRQAVAQDIIPAWVQVILPLLAALLIGAPMILHSLYPREAAVHRRRYAAQFGSLLARRREEMISTAK